MSIAAVLYFPIGKSCGGAERRLIRVFGKVFSEQKDDVIIAIHDRGIPEEVKNEVDKWSNGRAVYFNTIISLLLFLYKNRPRWIFAATLGMETVLVFFAAKIFGIKRCFGSVYHRTSMLNCSSKKANSRFLLLVAISNVVDCLYPYAIPLLEKRFPKKEILLTPGAFTDMTEFYYEDKNNLIAFVSTLREDKGVELFVNAIEKSRAFLESNNYSCILCGDGPLYDGIKNMVAEKELDRLILMPGRVVNIAERLKKAKIFCSLQYPTNYPSQALIEAIACGCYCIVTDCGESSMMINDSFGKLIPATATALSDAICDAIKSYDRDCDRIKESSREFAEKRFSMEESIQYYEQIALRD